MTQYAGRIGRPYQYDAVVLNTPMDDRTGAVFITVTGAFTFKMKNETTVVFASLPVGFLPGDFSELTSGSATSVFAVLVSV